MGALAAPVLLLVLGASRNHGSRGIGRDLQDPYNVPLGKLNCLVHGFCVGLYLLSSDEEWKKKGPLVFRLVTNYPWIIINH